MAHQVETMAYTNQVPWHGLGVHVADDLTPDEMLTAAGLDWTVSKRPLYFRKNADRVELKLIGNEFALVRDTDEKLLDIVGSNYNPIQNHEAFDFFDRFVKSGGMKMETAGSLKGGQFVWGLARIDESFNVGANDDEDRVHGYLLLTSPHKFGFSLVAALTPVRVVCMNTMRAALGSNLRGKKGMPFFRLTHAAEFGEDAQKTAIKALGLARQGMTELAEIANQFATVRMGEADFRSYFDRVIHGQVANEDATADAATTEQVEPEEASRTVKKLLDISQSAPGQDTASAKGTLWGAYNSVTYFADHVTGRNADNRLASAWYGPNNTMKRRALDIGIELAKAA